MWRSEWRRCVFDCTCSPLSSALLLLDHTSVQFSDLFYFLCVLLFDKICENVLALLPAVPPAVRGCELMHCSLSCSRKLRVMCGIKLLTHIFDIFVCAITFTTNPFVVFFHKQSYLCFPCIEEFLALPKVFQPAAKENQQRLIENKDSKSYSLRTC